MRLTSCIYQFFDQYLPHIKGCSPNTVKSYRDYTILHLLYDSGARAAEIANLRLDYFDCENRTLAILGKANRYRQIELLPKTTALINLYVTKYRRTPNAFCKAHLFISQRGAAFTRHGINHYELNNASYP